MDGLDLETIDRIDQDVFNLSPSNTSEDDDEEIPFPDCIGIDSAVQDDEQVRLKQNEGDKSRRRKSRSEKERELEVKVLNPGSIRRQILEQSLKDGNNKVDLLSNGSTGPTVEGDRPNGDRSHVMNIVEKAGMQGIDKARINEIIHEASKGSMFYKKQAQRQEEIHRSIQRMLKKVEASTESQVAKAKLTCDRIIEDLEKHRVFNRIIVHIDLDMFFAAVEIRDKPELGDKPIAVGSDSMVSTSNYIARKFGVRAAMPGFIAKKLCPSLMLIKPNGFKYRQASADVFSILEQFDPELTGMSLDEAYLDLTEYVRGTLEQDGLDLQEYYDGQLPKVWWTRAYEVVTKIRDSVFEKTKLTCSAGIACNTLLAKISTDMNKPNGQHMVQGYPSDVSDFIRSTPVGKVSGIGKVSGQFLNALGIMTCGDIFEKRYYLPLVFYDINVRFYLRVSLGDGSTCIKSDEQRKSKSVERTFPAARDTLVLLDKLDSICEELCTKYLKPYRIRGRTITVKLKRNTFTTTTKSYSMLVPTNDKLVVYSAAKNLLLSELANEPPEISFRLLGVKLSNLADDGVTTNQMTIDAMLRNHELSRNQESNPSDHLAHASTNGAHKEPENQARSEESRNVSPESTTESISEIQTIKCLDQNNGNTLKRKEPSTKRMEDFFATPKTKQARCSSPESDQVCDQQVSNRKSSQQEMSEVHAEFTIAQTGPNEATQEEFRLNERIDEDFRCPYCFKPYSEFNVLESHVENCYLRTSIDVYKPFFTQRIDNSDPSSSVAQLNSQTKSKAVSSTQEPSSRRTRTKPTLKPIAKISNHSRPADRALNSPDASSTKVSFYQKFLESNSPTLSQAAKLEPLQCPYCMHGFLSFLVLESHVSLCSKNKK